MTPWLLAARPKTLPAALVPVWVGAMPVLVDGDPATGSWLLLWCTLASCLCIQVATNLFNDAIDYAKGADTERRLGPKRVTATGLLSRRAVLGGACGLCLLAALVATPLILERGWPVVAIGAVSLFFAYGYTGGPFPLAYRGMGELFVILFFGFVAVLGSWFVQTGELGELSTWILGLQCGLYSSVLLAINNLRDIDEDRGTGKRTLAVRFGKTFARWEIIVFNTLPLLLWIVIAGDRVRDVGEFSQGASALPVFVVASLLGGMINRRVYGTEPSAAYNRFLAMGGVQLLLFGAMATVVFWGG